MGAEGEEDVGTGRLLAARGWSGWRIVGAGGVLALGAWAVSELWVDLARIASTAPGMAYLPLIPLVIAWMVWVRRWRGRLCRPGGDVLAPLVVGAGGVLYHLGATAGMGSAGPGATLALHLGGWLVVLGCLLAVCRQAVIQFLPAVGVLAFALPAPLLVGEGWAGGLHRTVGELTWTICYTLGMTGEGSAGLGVREISRSVAEVGSGLPFLLALCLVSYGFAFSRPWRWWVRALVLALSPLAAVLSGIVGLVVMAWLLGRLSPELGSLAWISRWGMLLVALVALAGLLKLLAWASLPLRVYPRASLEQ